MTVFAASITLGCGSPIEPSRASADVRPVPGIVLICVDTLRADAVALPGSLPGAMPALERFARSALCFVDASSSSSWTPPAVATLLTGLTPTRHGVQGGTSAPPLVGSVRTIAEALHDAGWHTSAVTAGGWVDPAQGLGQGFDGFSTAFDSIGPKACLATWQRKRALDKPFFLFLHTYAAHDPYGDKQTAANGACRPLPDALDPKTFVDAFRAEGRVPDRLLEPFALTYMTDPCGRRALSDALLQDRRDSTLPTEWLFGWLHGGYAQTPDRLAVEARVRTGYRAGLASVDDVVRQTLESLEALALPTDTVIAVVGDHGEGLGEHGSLYHGVQLYDELVRVPMLVRAPGRLPVGRVQRGSVGLVDVMPTLLDLAGRPAPLGIEGRSLLPLVRGEEGGHTVLAEVEGRALTREGAGNTRVVSVRSARAKWILTYDPSSGDAISEEFYDLVADPGEQAPIEGASPDRFGAEFCAAISRARNRVRRLAGLPALESPCGHWSESLGGDPEPRTTVADR